MAFFLFLIGYIQLIGRFHQPDVMTFTKLKKFSKRCRAWNKNSTGVILNGLNVNSRR